MARLPVEGRVLPDDVAKNSQVLGGQTLPWGRSADCGADRWTSLRLGRRLAGEIRRPTDPPLVGVIVGPVVLSPLKTLKYTT